MQKPKVFGALRIFMVIISMYILLILLLDTFIEMHPEIKLHIRYIDTFICAIFFIDFCYNFYTAPSKLAYMKWGWIDLLASIPDITIFRAFRAFSIFKVFRLFRAAKSAKLIYKYAFTSRAEGVIVSVSSLALLVILSGSILIIQSEYLHPNANIKTSEDAIWWTIVTMTTVGYGDYYPVTTMGRVIAVAIMLAGVGLFGTFTASIAGWILRHRLKNKFDPYE
jgi:voltage-gated potassium channel